MPAPYDSTHRGQADGMASTTVASTLDRRRMSRGGEDEPDDERSAFDKYVHKYTKSIGLAVLEYLIVFFTVGAAGYKGTTSEMGRLAMERTHSPDVLFARPHRPRSIAVRHAFFVSVLLR